jgi:hypothetical protein
MTYKTDEEIRNDALFQLDWDSRLRKSDINVTVKKGVVTLTGTVQDGLTGVPGEILILSRWRRCWRTMPLLPKLRCGSG